MSRKNATNVAKSQDVYLSFHMDSAFEQTCSTITKEIEKEFEDNYKIVYSNSGDGEVIVWINTPPLKEESEIRGFFQQLNHIFESCSIYTPHFTSFDKDE